MKTRILLLSLILAGHAARADNEVGFIEKFALAADREAVLNELLPGSEEYYFFHALQYQSSAQKDKLAKIMAEWATRAPGSAQRKIIEKRQALLAYDADPKTTLTFLRNHFNLQFEHQQEVRDKKPDLPTALDPARIARGQFQNRALNSDALDQFNTAALERLVRDKTALNPAQLRSLLSRIQRPDLPGILPLIEADLKTQESKGFGEFAIHRALLPEQLDALALRVPALYLNQAFVFTRMRKLQPGADTDLEFDPVAREAWLDRAWAYAKNLPPSFNSLKAQILHQRLIHDRSLGLYDRARIIEYIKLPRAAEYVPVRANQFPIDFNADLSEALIQAPPIRNDEWLIREALLEILATEPSYEPFATYLREDYLKALFAESKLVRGLENPQKWAALIPPSRFQALKDRVDLDFVPSNPKLQLPAEEVSIELEIKNVPKLLVKIYELNTLSFFLTHRRQLDTDLNLDGLVANSEKTHEFADGPLRRVRRKFTFPELTGERGAWVIEFIGGGKSSRTLIRKGLWTVLQQTGPAGEMLTIINESKQPVPGAVAWLDGHKFLPDPKSGRIVIPFTDKPGDKPLIIADETGQSATLTHFEHHAEAYRLDAQFHLEHEQLLAGREAILGLRTALWLGENRVAPALMESPKLSVTSTTLDGITTTREITGLNLSPDMIATHPITIPDRLATLTITLTARVENLSKGGTKQDISASRIWNMNGIDRTDLTYDAHLAKQANGFVLDLLGKNGEPLPHRQVVFTFTHRDFSTTLNIPLQSDDAGRIQLGPLTDLAKISAVLPNTRQRAWPLSMDQARRPEVIHAKAGTVIDVPWFGAGLLQPDQVSLLEKRAGTFTHDHFKTLSIARGFLQIKGLPPGDYSLRLSPEENVIAISVTAGTPVANWLVSDKRILEVRDAAPLQIEEIRGDADAFVIQVRNQNASTRVHVAATRFYPEENLFELGGFLRVNPATAITAREPNLSIAGRVIGDEFRYILERRYTKLFPGNMLPRPGLLLNPWEVRSTDVAPQAMVAGLMAGRAGGTTRQAGMQKNKGSAAGLEFERESQSAQPNLDFLADASPLILNLLPDPNGIVRIERKLLGDRQHLQVYVEDLSSAVFRSLAFSETKAKFQDLRLARNLDPQAHYSERKQVSLLGAGQTLTIPDILTSELETYDSLAGVHALFTTLSSDPKLTQFAWILQWPTLPDPEKRLKYSEFASHELNFFLSKKDPDFFKAVIHPYIANKKDKTFLDEWLLNADLSAYLKPWAFARLNMAERALLAQRIPAETAAISRHLRELFELVPPDSNRQEQLFETALRGRALQQGEADSFQREKTQLTAEMKQSGVAAFDAPLSPTPAEVGRFTGMVAKKTASPKMLKEEVLNEPLSLLDEDGHAKDALDASDLTGVEALRLRGLARQFYRALGATKEWAENNYHNTPILQQDASLIPINAFWSEFAAWDGKLPFLSKHLAEPSRNFPEMMLALGVLDLPFVAAKKHTAMKERQFTLTAAGPMVVYHKEIKPAPMAKESELLVSESYFLQGDRERIEGNERFEKSVTEEFLAGRVYGANVVITNPSSSPQALDILMQIPQGALPVHGSKATQSKRLRLEPYTTQRLEYFFYFPAAAVQPLLHYPIHVARNDQTVGSGKLFTFKVVNQLSKLDTASWDFISQEGSDAEVLAFLEKHNMERLNLERIAWRVRKDVKFFHSLLNVMEKRHIYQPTIYSYGIFHNQMPAITEWLRHQDGFLAECGPWLSTKLLKIDPIQRRTYEHLEYTPLINPRAHRLGGESRIANSILRGQYQALLNILAHKPALEPVDQMSLVYYLFLQDRVEEALARLAVILPETLPTRVQFDYFQCYAAFYREALPEARVLATKYADYPVDRWRKLFAEVTSQLNEIEGKAVGHGPKPGPGREVQQSELAGTEPSFDFKVENRILSLTWRNLKEVTINYYLMDPEFLFSSSPFVTEDPGRFSIIKPTKSLKQLLPPDKDSLEVPLPAEFARANVLVELLGAGQRKTQAYHSNSFKLSVAENYGRLEVRDVAANQPIPKVYVKVYARLQNGQLRYFKDGYTDLRGRFDYASLNGPENLTIQPTHAPLQSQGQSQAPMLKPDELAQVARLAILLLSPSHGAVVREVHPPSQ